MRKVITISRQYGSGGREIGEKLAKELGIPFYDGELISRAAKESGFSEQAFERAEEKITNSLLYSIAMGMGSYGNSELGFTNLSLDDRIYLAQADVIRKVASEGPCVIVGRCADYILKGRKELVNIFIWADIKDRVKRATTQYGLVEHKAEENILKIDKRRANYYNYHANEKWGRAENYDFSINTSYTGIDHAVQCIKTFILKGDSE
ncbi:cytidylate kinase-like family protein [Anaeromicropila herbilytica]|uniref:Cytidylate kinase n=1 Tax=Anaeromicropila herbilytica TaxID=2785025 RepID=A0A7R7EPB7_9FIRM|nr:cytidylate kinase-like family protein [Anaeromicropila herbilytica]BCN32444.1 cytidylate kinase [Anaeromicropila herbilytica]